nr:unnamed protein product [Callosobruchus analis]
MYLMKKGQSTYSMVKALLKIGSHPNQEDRDSSSHLMVL